uniref:NAD(P)-binding domain-containing protein n=1 Tax=Haptolina brevifila TaxID=156173 RepID=A0A7S2GM22_9EUKA|mmetsp:Transcript_39591/g.79135  ORF Transcript_39591/g.79135 Transcript_39591/m.79135 type:complete len:293 (+) Transcript_39591:61-939(+)
MSHRRISITLTLWLLSACKAARITVAVTGAGGQTGQHAFRKMLARPDDFSVIGIVRSQGSKDALVASGVPSESVVVADVCDPEAIAEAIKGCGALVIGTSAKPAPTGQTDEDSGRPVFSFPNGEPELVDWLGQKSQIDAALLCGDDTHVVLCSSMGGTDPSNMLNALGRKMLADGSQTGGNILLWKRKAEMYLMSSGLPYTIVHPGGLLNEEGGKREIVIGVDDERTEGERSIPREDVAEVMVQALQIPAYRGRSFDIRSKLEGEGEVTTNFAALLDKLEGRNCDYSLGEVA